MKRFNPLLVAFLFLGAFQVFGAPPCRPGTLGRVHVPVFVPSTNPQEASGTSGQTNGLEHSAAPSELDLQTQCLVWESAVQPRAEFDTGAILPSRTASVTHIVSSRAAASPVISDNSFLNHVPGTGGFLQLVRPSLLAAPEEGPSLHRPSAQ